jgi:hypothetical protein
VAAGGGGGGAPTDATYITQTSNATLSAEQALSSLTTGIVKVTNGTGVLSTAVAGTDYAAAAHAHVDADIPNTITIDLAATATNLAANPTDCGANQFCTGTGANAACVCAQPGFSNLSGSATSAQLPSATSAAKGAVLVPAAACNATTGKVHWDGTQFSCGTDQTSAGGGYVTVYDEASALTQQSELVFTGDGVSASDNGSQTVVEIDDIAALTTDLDCASCVNLAAEVGGTLPIGNGGTGQTGAVAAFDALAPTTTQGDIIYHNGTDNVRLAKGSGLQQLRMNAGATAPEWFTASGGSDPWTLLKKTDADQTSTAATITLTSITSLNFSMSASTDYELDCTILYSGNTAANGVGLTVDLSGTVTLISVGIQIEGAAADGVGSMWSGMVTADADPVLGVGVAAINTVYVAYIRGAIRNDASVDTATIQFRNEVSAAGNTVTIKTGSFCRYRTI